MRAIVLIFLAATLAVPAAGEELTLENIFEKELFDAKEFPDITWIEGGKAYLTYEATDDGAQVWTRHDTRSGKTREWLRLTSLQEDGEDLEIDGILVPDDERYLLIQTRRTQRWRYSYTADHWIYVRKTQELSRLSEGGQEIHVQLSPDGARIGYVQGGNLFVRALDAASPRALTTDGSDVVFNGDPDWAYEEELGLLETWWWSPDSERIAYLHTDSSAIGSFPLVKMGEGSYPTLSMLPYPKAGTDNSSVTLRVVDVASGRTRDVRTVGPDDGYIARVNWVPGADALVYQWINRAQNRLELTRVEVGEELTRRVLLTEDSPGWIEVKDDLLFVDGGFLWTSERDGYNHLYRYSDQRGELTQVTTGPWVVRSVLHADDDQALLLTARDSELGAQLDRVDLDDGDLERLSEAGGWHSVDVAPNGKHYLETRSTKDERPELRLRREDGRLVRALVEDDMADMAGLPRGEDRFLKFHASTGVELNARMTYPSHFDERQKYPVLIFCYGGPESQTVRDRWDTRGRDLFHRLMAEQGYLIFTVDGRGTAGRGREFKAPVHRKLGQLEVEDQLAGVDYLTSLPYVDAERIGLWGWSYGGYLTAMTALAAEGRIAVGIVGAPVSDWRFYDTIYTERFMGTPQDNAEGYDRGSALTDVDPLRTRLLLIHGSADDNVHFQNSLRFMAELQNAGKPFEVMVYPDRAHGVRDGRIQAHMYGTMRDFLFRNLGQGPLPNAEMGS